jgi:hypothetical protein
MTREHEQMESEATAYFEAVTSIIPAVLTGRGIAQVAEFPPLEISVPRSGSVTNYSE